MKQQKGENFVREPQQIRPGGAPPGWPLASASGARRVGVAAACLTKACYPGPRQDSARQKPQHRRLHGYAYSDRLARGDIIWDAATIGDLFTRGPDVVTPGTKMPVQRVDNAEDLAALLRFLEGATK